MRLFSGQPEAMPPIIMPRLAEGDAAVHAAGRLGLLLLAGEPDVKFVEVFDALQRRNIRAGLARIIHKSSEFCP